VGQADFSKSPRENKSSLNMSTACLFREIDAQIQWDRKTKHFIIVHKSILKVFTQEFSLIKWLHVRPEIEHEKNWSVPIFLGLWTDQNKKFTLL